MCCTRFAQDNLWYRGKVLEVTQNEVVIQYVDYGNRETKSASEIKLMHPNFYALPAQAIRCSLVGVAPKQASPSLYNGFISGYDRSGDKHFSHQI